MILIALSVSKFCANIRGLLLQFIMIFLSFTIRISLTLDNPGLLMPNSVMNLRGGWG